VVIDEPVIDHYGGTVAGPVFRRVAEASLRHLGVAPAHGGAKLSEIVKRLRADEGAQASARTAAAPSKHGEAGLTTPVQAGQVLVPDLTGKGARTALVLLKNVGLSGTLSGSGAVSEQVPSPGISVASGALVQLVLRRPTPSERGPEQHTSPAPSESGAGKLATAEAVP
jgi:cell division protein FtsI (penicillin-binding protein 3)